MNPLFSCVMPVKGERPFFDEALASLCSQGLGDALEIIVQDGDIEHDAGQSDALNKGFAKARGEWLFWLNADDVLLPGALKQIASLIHPTTTTKGDNSLNWIAGSTVYCNVQGIATDVRSDRRWHDWLYRRMPVWTHGPSAFFRRELWFRLGGFDTTLRYIMDIDLWTRWAQAGERFVMLRNPVWGFRWHEGSLTSGSAHAKAREEEWQLWLRRSNMHHVGLYRELLRITQVLDGSYFLRCYQTARWRGKMITGKNVK